MMMKQLLEKAILVILIFVSNQESIVNGFQSSLSSPSEISTPLRGTTRTTLLLNHNNNNNNKDIFSVRNPRQRNVYSHHEENIIIDDGGRSGGIYRPFADYAWEKLMQSNLVEETTLPDHLATNSSPAKDPKSSAEEAAVSIHVKSASGIGNSSIRMGRYALLETMGKVCKDNCSEEKSGTNTSSSSSSSSSSSTCNSSTHYTSNDNAIHVLNFVIFPNHKDYLIPLPVLGIDLVTLPGMKHLIAIDFQPITEAAHADSNATFPLSKEYKQFEMKLEQIHERYVMQYRDILPWGGDIPPKASRFFSKYALWTRLQGNDAIDIIQTRVFDAFKAYFDLYLEMMTFVQYDNVELKQDASSVENHMQKMDKRNMMNMIQKGNVEYLNYRRENDPARPMLTRLYGSEYTEDLISQVLFEMI